MNHLNVWNRQSSTHLWKIILENTFFVDSPQQIQRLYYLKINCDTLNKSNIQIFEAKIILISILIGNSCSYGQLKLLSIYSWCEIIISKDQRVILFLAITISWFYRTKKTQKNVYMWAIARHCNKLGWLHSISCISINKMSFSIMCSSS